MPPHRPLTLAPTFLPFKYSLPLKAFEHFLLTRGTDVLHLTHFGPITENIAGLERNARGREVWPGVIYTTVDSEAEIRDPLGIGNLCSFSLAQ